jgi:hypothetical protein
MRHVGASLAIFVAVTAITGFTGATASAAPSALSASPASGVWNKIVEVPGLGDLSPGVNETLTAISCTGPGDCTAGGADNSTDPTHAFGLNQAWVASEASGTWGNAQAVPGTAALNTSGGAQTTAVSCSWPGNCVAVGSADYQYNKTAGGTAGFVVNQVNGTWGTARPVPAFTSAVHSAQVTAVSCAPATTTAARKAGLNCVAAGVSQLPGGSSVGLVLTEVNGAWRAAQPVPGLPSARPGSAVTSVSCPSPGSCGIGGYYSDKSGRRQAFVASEVGGTWRRAQQVPGTATLNAGGNASVTSVSCRGAGACVAAGTYRPSKGPGQLFVVIEGAGQWKRAVQLPGSGKFITGNGSAIGQVSCASTTFCEVGGTLQAKVAKGFLAGELNGRWGTLYVLAPTINALSCPAPGDCVAGGQRINPPPATFLDQASAVVIDQAAGHWGKSVPLYSGENLIPTTDSVYAISCTAPRECGAGGEGTGGDEALPFAFVANERPVK